ncbi:glycoside hydrolase family 16 protein [Abortiporus biennis]|nr:glycoside hydrolase family 16 protein [Abortiporus biennis]
MWQRSSLLLTLLFASVYHSDAWIYTISDSYVGQNFLETFQHIAIPDPTHGRTNYVDQLTAQYENLTFVDADSLILQTDFTNVVDPNSPGRNSVRIQSLKAYTTHAAIFDVRHIPEGCGTWPAIWETGPNWPSTGEVDILEGANNQSPSQSTLHTSPGCSMPPLGQAGRTQSGRITQDTYGQDNNICDADMNNNAGCGVLAPSTDSFGREFNANGGGWYALERTPDNIRIWFWSRPDPSTPTAISSEAFTIDTSLWGTPIAHFPASISCDLNEHFGPNNIIIDIALCGDLASATFTDAGCGTDCATFVDQNPTAFIDAYFDIASIRVFEP